MVNIKERFDNLTPGQKKLVVWSLLAAAFLLVSVVGYNSSRAPERNESAPPERTREIALEPEMLQKTMLREQRRELDQMRSELARLREERDEDQEQAKQRERELEQLLEQQLELPSANDLEQLPPLPGGQMNYPPPPGDHERFEPTSGIPAPPPPPEPAQMIGSISVLTNERGEAAEPAEDKKKESRSVYLPPSFMEARLLTGFDASTSGAGANNPEPILLRIQTPAVLPNDVKANLRGCFVVAEAVGRLHKERADVRLVSLNCLNTSGDAVIDTPIKGFVTDSDSKVGLSGRVVSRMGAAAARSVMAGIFGGAGDALQIASQTQSISPLGSTSVIDSSGDIAKSALGSGLSSGAGSLGEFYLELAKQATPVIEVSATKNITVVISEGRALEIREITNDSF